MRLNEPLIPEVRIRAETKGQGKHLVRCPWCEQNARNPFNRRRASMVLFLEGKRVNWHCFNCDWKGADDPNFERASRQTTSSQGLGPKPSKPAWMAKRSYPY